MRAFLDAGLRVPEDVSVVGFDDIQSAAYHNPTLTTVRQPLREMGEIAARLLLERIAGGETRRSGIRDRRSRSWWCVALPARAPRSEARKRR